MLGDAIAESGGPDLLADVEELGRATIAFRGRPTAARRATSSAWWTRSMWREPRT